MIDEMTLEELEDRAVAHLSKAATSDGADRTAAQRALAASLIDIREKLLRPEDGDNAGPDWLGKSYAYKRSIARVYSRANLPKDVRARIQSVVRYHISEMLHRRFSDEELEGLGLRTETLDERRVARRDRSVWLTQFVESEDPLSADDVDTAFRVIRQLLDRMTPGQRAEVALRLADRLDVSEFGKVARRLR